MQNVPKLPYFVSSRPNRAARLGIDPKEGGEQPLQQGSQLSDSLGLMLRFKADITLPCVILLRDRITVYDGKLGFGKWPLDVSCCPVLKKCFCLRVRGTSEGETQCVSKEVDFYVTQENM